MRDHGHDEYASINHAHAGRYALEFHYHEIGNVAGAISRYELTELSDRVAQLERLVADLTDQSSVKSETVHSS